MEDLDENKILEAEASGEFEDDEEEYNEIAPENPIKWLKFMADKKNRKDGLWEMPQAVRIKVMKVAGIAIAILLVSTAFAILNKSAMLFIYTSPLLLITLLILLKRYLDGSTRQYVQIKGEVIKSDYQKNLALTMKAAVKKTAKADFRYRTFILKRSEGEYVRFTCHKNRELPQVGDNLRVTMHVKTSVFEDEGLTQVGDYIAIERIA